MNLAAHGSPKPDTLPVMDFVPFELERWQSTWEHRVRINLSESGVHALSVEELLRIAGATPDDLLRLHLGYGQSDGSEPLRTAIAALYPGATADQVTVTVGSAEANFCACWALFRQARRVVIVAPTYMQMWGLAENFRARVKPVWLDPARGWEPDLDEIRRVITRATDVVVVTDPNNPTGHVLSAAARAAILNRVRASGAWLIVDEVYQGAEHHGPVTPTWWGAWERTLVVNGLSKAYGLPGLRIGWIVSPAELRGPLLERHDYTVIGPGPVADHLARCAVQHRERIFARTRDILHTNYPVLAEWLASFGDAFTWHAPDAGAICFVRCNQGPATLDVVERVRAEQDILLVPGDHFRMPGWLRLGFGNPTAELRDALATLSPAVGRMLR
jgi:aspartate/methionine/tyrosine aminotransferase